jgi:hypothetical protein
MSSDGSRSDGESSEEQTNVFLELGADPTLKHFALDEDLSLPLRRVFKFQNLEGVHETLGLADIMTMIRGSPTEFLPHVKHAYLGVFDSSTKRVGTLGKAEAQERDPRVLGITEWTAKVPLPLGGDLYNSLRIVFHLSSEIPDSQFKLCADVVPVPRQFLESDSGSRPKMKRFLSWGHSQASVLRLQGGTVIALENPKSALEDELPCMTETIQICTKESTTKPSDPTENSSKVPLAMASRQYTWSEIVKKIF